jgi:hypothetical protein
VRAATEISGVWDVCLLHGISENHGSLRFLEVVATKTRKALLWIDLLMVKMS